MKIRLTKEITISIGTFLDYVPIISTILTYTVLVNYYSLKFRNVTNLLLLMVEIEKETLSIDKQRIICVNLPSRNNYLCNILYMCGFDILAPLRHTVDKKKKSRWYAVPHVYRIQNEQKCLSTRGAT